MNKAYRKSIWVRDQKEYNPGPYITNDDGTIEFIPRQEAITPYAVKSDRALPQWWLDKLRS